LLEVREDNPRARQLYRRHGFTEIGIRRGYYQPSGANAVVMRKELAR
jgi:ribosomal-protein-alanine N-acetyltransferase